MTSFATGPIRMALILHEENSSELTGFLLAETACLKLQSCRVSMGFSLNQTRGAGSNLEQGGGGGSISKKGTLYYCTLANKQKSLNLKNNLTLLNLYD